MIQSFPKLKKSKQHKYNCLQIEKLQKLSIYLFFFFNLKKAQNMDLIFCNLQKLKKHESYFLQATKSKNNELFVFFQIKKPEKTWI